MDRRELLAAGVAAVSGLSVTPGAGATPPRLRAGETPWPTPEEVNAYAAECARAEETQRGRVLFKHFVVREHPRTSVTLPLVPTDTDPRVIGLRELTLTGPAVPDGSLQGKRGLNGAPLPADVREVEPAWRPRTFEGFQTITDGGCDYPDVFGCYGEYLRLFSCETEPKREIRARGEVFTGPDRRQAVQDRVRQLVARRYDRIEWATWKLLAGEFLRHHVAGIAIFGVLVTPHSRDREWLKDYRTFFRRYSAPHVAFGDPRATAYISYSTADYLAHRLGLPLKPEGFSSLDPDSREAMTAMLRFREGFQARLDAALGDWGGPRIVRYGQGYLDADGRFREFIPPGRFIVFGHEETTAPVGAYITMPNAANPGLAPRPHTRLVETPRGHEVHDGHNGGPVVDRPRAVLVCDVSHDMNGDVLVYQNKT